jgi:hypothetical protein
MRKKALELDSDDANFCCPAHCASPSASDDRSLAARKGTEMRGQGGNIRVGMAYDDFAC